MSEAHTPSIAAAIPLSDWFELGANYCYEEKAAYDLVDDGVDRREADLHRFSVGADWYFAGEAAPGLDLKADYSYSRDAADTGGGYQEHAGKISLALRF